MSEQVAKFLVWLANLVSRQPVAFDVGYQLVDNENFYSRAYLKSCMEHDPRFTVLDVLGKRRDRFAFLSTGDAEKGARITSGFQLNEQQMRLNICPNGCGPMNWLDAHNRHCPTCNFHGFSTKPFDAGSETPQ